MGRGWSCLVAEASFNEQHQAKININNKTTLNRPVGGVVGSWARLPVGPAETEKVEKIRRGVRREEFSYGAKANNYPSNKITIQIQQKNTFTNNNNKNSLQSRPGITCAFW